MASEIFHFGPFELNVVAYALVNGARPVHLERLPMDLLILLARSHPRLVSREEIIERLWGKQTFIDVDNALNTAIRKIRRSLGEHPEQPLYLETVVGKGYRLKVDTPRGPVAGRDGLDGRIMLVVLPFENLSGDVGQDYFSDGLTEETIACLAQLLPERLGVIARTTSMAYKGTDKTIIRIGAELGVDYVLEGSVRSADGQVRVIAQLIRVRDQCHVWAHSYDRQADRVLDIQMQMGAAIADQVQLRLTTEQNRRLFSGIAGHVGAHDDYLRGLHHQAKVTHAELNKAIACFQRATRLDPGFAAAYAALAHCFIRLPIACDVPAAEAFPQAREAIRRALERDPDSTHALAADAQTKFWFDWDFAAARDTAQRAIDLNPNHAPASLCLAHVCSNLGDHAAALREIRRALALDPLSLLVNAMYGQFLYHAGKDEEALEQFESAFELEPRFWIAHICAAKAYERLGRYREALAACEHALAYSGGNSEALSIAGYVHAVAGARDQAELKIRELLGRSPRAYVPPYNLALVFAGLGDSAAALGWLERALEERDVHMVFLRDHKWDRMRALPQFRELVNKV
ncbi:MAG: winged helix-turn-helix domain-containing protein, partial [Rhodanobacteraceae bacterium]